MSGAEYSSGRLEAPRAEPFSPASFTDRLVARAINVILLHWIVKRYGRCTKLIHIYGGKRRMSDRLSFWPGAIDSGIIAREGRPHGRISEPLRTSEA